MNITGVCLGRFAPIHKGHQKIIGLMIRERGLENCLVLVGSSSSLNSRTPYTFEERKKMIQTIYPEIEVLPLPDIKPELIQFDQSTNDLWLDSIQKIERDRQTKFVFYGGSQTDLAILSERFETKILEPRDANGNNYSATAVREALKNGQDDRLRELVDSRILEWVKRFFRAL